MHGNVWEWCSDRYGEYGAGPVSDPVGPDSGSNRVNRGGSGSCTARLCRSAYRDGNTPRYESPHQGFRVSQVPAEQE